jgi:hypothetical protein
MFQGSRGNTIGIPSRFAIEYPQRALQLIEMLEPRARNRDLVGSFGLLAASAVLTIPYERMQSRHFLHQAGEDGDLAGALQTLKTVPFYQAAFWRAEAPGPWWQSRIVSAVEKVDDWRDEDDRHPLSIDAANRISDRKRSADDVIRVLRNALAHGNIIFLDKEFRENVGRRMAYMAFLSRYEEGLEQQKLSKTYRLVVTSEAEFLRFVKLWASWVGSLADDGTVAEAA